jgi:hypothetical protein
VHWLRQDHFTERCLNIQFLESEVGEELQQAHMLRQNRDADPIVPILDGVLEHRLEQQLTQTQTTRVLCHLESTELEDLPFKAELRRVFFFDQSDSAVFARPLDDPRLSVGPLRLLQPAVEPHIVGAQACEYWIAFVERMSFAGNDRWWSRGNAASQVFQHADGICQMQYSVGKLKLLRASVDAPVLTYDPIRCAPNQRSQEVIVHPIVIVFLDNSENWFDQTDWWWIG